MHGQKNIKLGSINVIHWYIIIIIIIYWYVSVSVSLSSSIVEWYNAVAFSSSGTQYCPYY